MEVEGAAVSCQGWGRESGSGSGERPKVWRYRGSKDLEAHDSDHGALRTQWGGSQDLGAPKDPRNADPMGECPEFWDLALGVQRIWIWRLGSAICVSGVLGQITRLRRPFGTSGIWGAKS